MTEQQQTERIRQQYEDYIRLRNIRFFRIGIALGMVIIAYLAYSDIHVTKMPASIALLWRSIPMAIGLVSLAVTATSLKKNARVVSFLYGSGLASLLVMMYGLLFNLQGVTDTRNFELGLFLDMFLIFVFSNGGIRFLLPVYCLPLTAFIFFQTVYRYHGDIIRVMLNLTNEIIATIVLLVFSGAVEKLRFNEFGTRKLLEYNNELMENRNREIENELELARSIQKSLMPSRLPEIPGTRLSLVYHPMEAVGGDYVDFIDLDGGKKLGIFVCDVSGHGVPAALIAGMIKALNESCEDTRDPENLLRYLNLKLTRFLKNHFVTALYAVYDPARRELTCARGGHVYPLLVRQGSVREIVSDGKCLGTYRDIAFEQIILPLESGDRVLFFTDGLIESRNPAGSMYDETLRRDLVSAAGEDDTDFACRIFNSLTRFAGGEKFNDDICVVGLEIL